MLKKIKKSLKYIKFRDLFTPIIFLIILPCSLIFKLINKIKNKNIWLICESGTTARDNGYYFYKYLKENHKELSTYYVIDKKSNDYKLVKELGNIIQYKSFKHWLYYLSATYNISSQKNGNPNQVFFYVLHVFFGLYKNRIFLQHGIIKDYLSYLTYKNTKFKLFICSTEKEYNYVKKVYKYPDNNIKLTGLARFDSLHDLYKVNKNQILIMPTWRDWLGRDTNFLGKKYEFKKTNYYKKWQSLLNNKQLIKFIEENNIELLFYQHINMEKFKNNFISKSKNIKILDSKTNIQQILKESILLITDYSSVYMDFAYMKKLTIYYQFDYKEYRTKQYSNGYFDYIKDGFGPVVYKEKELINKIIESYNNKYKLEKIYKNRIKEFFTLNDNKNCERIYKEIINIEK